MNYTLARINKKIMELLDEFFRKFQRKLLIGKLKSCGTNCMFQMPIIISGAECVEIGNDVSIAAFVHMWGYGKISIGNQVMIASHTAISSLTHDYTKKSMHTTMIKKPVVIADNVWIGSHSVIMPGVSIGKGSVIGAGSVVTKDVEPYSIMMGAPARLYMSRPFSV
jgi:acetyltransferase-like isoleucine patch superfamily enzyme